MSRKRVVVVGGGAAGMIAAGRAAEMGAEVILLEKMERQGKKLLISGNTRCNLTNMRSLDDFIPMYGKNGRFLHSAFSHFFRDELIELLSKYGVRTSAEPDGRIFPSSGESADVVNALDAYMKQYGVHARLRTSALAIEQAGGRARAVHAADGTFETGAVVLAAGGSSYPQTGSNGDGYRIAEGLGHTIVKLRPALVPLELAEKGPVKELQGISLKGVRVTTFACSKENIKAQIIPRADTGRGIQGKSAHPPLIESRTGDLIFTHYGASGPAVLLMSLPVTDALSDGPASLTIDLFPNKDREQIQGELQRELNDHGSRHVRTIIEGLVPASIARSLLKVIGIAPEKTAGQISAAERKQIIGALKDFRFDIRRPRPLSEAMVTAGGVSLDEVNPRTMESKLVKGLYLCGELLDIDADTGGFNLQAAFSTGHLAGESAAQSS